MRNLKWTTLMGLMAMACSGGTDTDSQNEDTGTEIDDSAFSEYINVEVAPTGDFGDFEGCQTYADCTWTTLTVESAHQQTVEMTGRVLDFETDDAVPDATLEIWFSDEVVGPADVEVVSDSSGNVSTSLDTCSPMALLVSTDPLLEETKPTYEFHAVYGHQEDGVLSDEEFNSVSEITYRIIPSLLGVSPDPTRGIAAGTAYDSTGAKIEGAQVIVRSAEDGSIHDGVVVKYFIDDFPNRNQPYTSPDGLWVAINIPEGTSIVEMWVSDGAGGHLLMGATIIDVIADSINVASTYTGIGDGVNYPESCLEGSTSGGGDDTGSTGGDTGSAGGDTGSAGGDTGSIGGDTGSTGDEE